MVTATHDRRRDPHVGVDPIAEWGQRSAFGPAKGWPWWAVVVLALALSIAGAFIDMHTSGDLGKVFEGGYFLGCVGAVCFVRRRNLFGPMVQPPLILAVTIPVVVLLTKGMPSGSGTVSKLITLGVPLVTGFPTMAITTGATLVIGGIRFLVQRKPASDDIDGDDRDEDDRGDARRRPADRDGERGERSAGTSRPRPGGQSRVAQGRTARDEGDRGRTAQAESDRGRTPSSRSRSEAPERSSRSGTSRPDRERSSRDPERGQGRDRGQSRERGDSRERGEGRARDESRERGEGRERGQAPRSSQSRDRDRGEPRDGRPARGDGRGQPPPRRRDDDY